MARTNRTGLISGVGEFESDDRPSICGRLVLGDGDGGLASGSGDPAERRRYQPVKTRTVVAPA